MRHCVPASYRDLLDELDRVLRDFERNTRVHRWLGELGSPAGAGALGLADAARKKGAQLGAVDLASFVMSAVEAESSTESVTRHPDGTIELRLPSAWQHGLEDRPGFDAPTRTLRVTTSRDQMSDGKHARWAFSVAPIPCCGARWIASDSSSSVGTVSWIGASPLRTESTPTRSSS